jgi:hypothetical protein
VKSRLATAHAAASERLRSALKRGMKLKAPVRASWAAASGRRRARR